MRIAVLGAAGQLGFDFVAQCRRTPHDVIPLTREQFDFNEPTRVAAVLDSAAPDLVVNCVAYNLVDKAEDEPDIAYRVNALGPRHLAQWCERRPCRLLHVGSDYVFGGTSHRRAFTEADLPAPNSAYAISKLAGEYFVQSECSRSYVVRTCGLYGVAARQGKGKGNFVETMLRLGRDRPQLRVVNDQVCTPTSTADLAAALIRLVETDTFGLYHATNAGQMTWCELAREIFQVAQMPVEVVPITTAEFGAKARRPAFSVLNCQKLAAVIGQELPDWHDALRRYLASREVIS